MKKSDIPASELKLINEKISNALKLRIGPSLANCDVDCRYYVGLVGDKIAIHETLKVGLTRIVAYFPHTDDGKIAALRCCDSLNSPKDEVIEIYEDLSFEK